MPKRTAEEWRALMSRIENVMPGWHPLVQPVLDRAKELNVPVAQVKEKFGHLRIYLDERNEELYTMIHEAQRKSETTCELCGAPGQRRGGGWVKTLCEPCEPRWRNRSAWNIPG